MTEMQRLGELITIKHGYAFESRYFGPDGPYVLLTPGNFEDAGGFRRKADQKHYDGPVPSEFILKEGDLLIAMTEQAEGLLGSGAFVPGGKPCLHNQRLGLVQARDPAVNLRYIYYALNSRPVRQQIRATATGAKVRHTAPVRICNVRISKLNRKQQDQAAVVLGAYDDLIEVNRRRSALLEDMARSLFEEWFVRFRFPGYENVAINNTADGPLPEGWRITTLNELLSECRDAVMPADVPPEARYVALEHIPRRSITLDDFGPAADATSLKLRFQRGDILFGKIRPYFHKVVWAPWSGIASSDALILRPTNADTSALALCLVSSDAFVAHAVQTSNGTKMPRANWSVLKRYPVPIPPVDLLKRFSAIAALAVELAANLQSQNEILGAARDLLLPRLISGQLTLPAVEREFEESVPAAELAAAE